MYYIFFIFLFVFIVIFFIVIIKGYNSKKGVSVSIYETNEIYVTFYANLDSVGGFFPYPYYYLLSFEFNDLIP